MQFNQFEHHIFLTHLMCEMLWGHSDDRSTRTGRVAGYAQAITKPSDTNARGRLQGGHREDAPSCRPQMRRLQTRRIPGLRLRLPGKEDSKDGGHEPAGSQGERQEKVANVPTPMTQC